MQANEWRENVGRKWADEWRRTDRSFGSLTDRLLGHASAGAVNQVLDIGCGAGEVSLALGRSHSRAQILGIDISDQLLDVARQRGENLPNVQFENADAATWHSDNFTPDLLVSRHGVMFFDNPTNAFVYLKNVARPDAKLVFSCFRDISENSWANQLVGLLPGEKPAAPQSMAPGPFAFANRDAVSAMLADAGWRDIQFESFDFAYIAGMGDDPLEDAVSYFLNIGPAARAAADLPADQRKDFILRLERFLEHHLVDNLVALQAGAWIVTAKASSS